MDNSNRLFRKAVFGGFNKDDVIDYIESMKNEFFEYRKQVEKTIEDLNKKISELEQAGSIVSGQDNFSFADEVPDRPEAPEDVLQSNVSFSVEEINTATEHLKETADSLCKSLTDFMDRISSSCISVKVEAPIDSTSIAAEDTDTKDSFADSISDILNEKTQEPSPEEIAAAYQQAMKIKGDSILASAFGQDRAQSSSVSSKEESDETNSSFSDLLDSILNAQEPKQENHHSQAESNKEASILDDLLSSSSFLN